PTTSHDLIPMFSIFTTTFWKIAGWMLARTGNEPELVKISNYLILLGFWDEFRPYCMVPRAKALFFNEFNLLNLLPSLLNGAFFSTKHETPKV
ncbi:MAG: hypothetical protein ACXVBE_16780, partial [Bdellovibrionota bacterium]